MDPFAACPADLLRVPYDADRTEEGQQVPIAIPHSSVSFL